MSDNAALWPLGVLALMLAMRLGYKARGLITKRWHDPWEG